jgi:hypothetical protein
MILTSQSYSVKALPWPLKVVLDCLITAVLFLPFSCSTEVDLNGPYKEKGIVYCLLNPDSTIQYARISKSFQNRTKSATEIAKNDPDSSNFAIGRLKVELFEIGRDGKPRLVSTFSAIKDTNKLRDGDFYAPNQILYKSTPYKLHEEDYYRYKLVITDLVTNYTTDASCLIPGYFYFRSPSLTLPKLGFILPTKDASGTSRNNDPVISVSNSSNTKINKLNISTTYAEYVKNGSGKTDTILHTFSWNGAGNFSEITPTTTTITSIPNSVTFFNKLTDDIKAHATPNVQYRQFRGFVIDVWAADEGLYNYYIVSNSLSITSDASPVYSNFRDGLGLLSSRRFIRLNARVDAAMLVAMNKMNGTSPLFPELFNLKFQ